MSFSLTTKQMRARAKDVTRRTAWRNLKPGEHIMAVVKCMGLKRGEQQVPIEEIVVVNVRFEPLSRMTEDRAYGKEECRREGFPDIDPQAFVTMFCATHRDCTPDTIVNRIEFRPVG